MKSEIVEIDQWYFSTSIGLGRRRGGGFAVERLSRSAAHALPSRRLLLLLSLPQGTRCDHLEIAYLETNRSSSAVPLNNFKRNNFNDGFAITAIFQEKKILGMLFHCACTN